MLKEKIESKEAGILTYGMTPPKITNTSDKVAEIARKQVERINDLDIDALILYDVQEETDRVEQERPFPYLPTMDPATYCDEYLNQLRVPKIIYRCVGRYSEEQFVNWVKADVEQDRYSVYVGASSSKQEINLELSDAYDLSKRLNNNLTFGGVVIPERHMKKNDEHLRVNHKTQNGCSFFVSQATYNVEASKNFLSDYYYYYTNNGLEMVPILFNLAPCGSEKTLEFMKWLGISIPTWLENDLKYSQDVLDKSLKLSLGIFEEILDFALEKGIPIGCSVESVSTRKVEIEASVQLVRDIRAMLDKKLNRNVLTSI
ncbi:methylenetetrahydrofolate reductase [Paenibacillus chondroitinus]|uniref:Methylenetetrahydrofolate reductase n=1 Tax=Paenibacillus chondroitinus TaxID=59842 RepID=A0ABU6DF30_9BACL|nr:MULTISPECIES: methylenetetrahydrofolate reductase [Paenibacillus]MCY9659304.1 methylenetetrahydrofolate reductase [Paenibacillus anseongense]MEB4796360.1 methylenetetrahydrofolate reductase [Paenibacillus chondroitinus]